MLNNIVIITAQYPTKEDPVYTFIRPVACGLADHGLKVSVIAPQSITNTLKRRVKFRPHHWIDYSDNGNIIDIYQPKYVSVSMMKIHGFLISHLLYEAAIINEYKHLKLKPDLVYAHFWESAVVASYAVKNDNTPIVAVSGEDHVSVYEGYPVKKIQKAVKKVKGLICVSTKNLEECISLQLTNSNMKMIVLPNAIDSKIFHPISREKARKKLKWEKDSIIAIFVGEFSNRKGVNRLIQAAKKVPYLKLVLIGTGDSLIESDQILFQGIVSHNMIPLYLNASDFFVLPTLAEGCCNAIVEALACGLPIVSSDRKFNYDILNKNNSILVDPEKISDISDAMLRLSEDYKLRLKLSKGSIEKSHDLNIETRVKKIKIFLEDIING